MEINKKRIAIYGAGTYGRAVINTLQKTKHIFISMVCDSDEKRWGKSYEGYVISPPDKIFEEKNLDGVFISILAENDVEEYILSRKKVSIYKEIHEIVAEYVYWDISGICNARCKYCVTGRNNRNIIKKNIENLYMNLESFKKNYKHLYENGIISKESHLALFNWKESFLNPDIMEILDFCSKEGQRYGLSTNASIVRLATDKNTYSKCEQINFSMPGFSQESYDRIHGFSFDIIKKNILEIKENMLEHGFSGNFVISAHIYRFSEDEIESLKEWAEKNGLCVNAYYPYLAGNSLVVDYFENRINESMKKEISEELFIQWENEIDQKNLRNFRNPLCNYLTIDERGNITLCCAADEFCDFYDTWGKIEEIRSYESYKRLRKKMLQSKTCMQCRKYAIAYRILQ